MMKQNKNKKGRLAKSTLSVVLAASMVMTSSSFVWASPVQEIPVEVSAYGLEEQVGAGEATWKDALEVAESDYNSTIKSDATFSWELVNKAGETSVLAGDDATLAAGTLDGAAVGGTVKCTVNGKGGDGLAADPVEVTFTITSYELTETNLAIDNIDGQPYIGKKIEPEVTLTTNTEQLTEDDYIIEYGENLNAGTGTVTLTLTEAGISKGYSLPNGSITKNFNIAKADLTGYSINLSAYSLDSVYTGEAITPLDSSKTALTVKNEAGVELTIPAGDYKVTYNPTEVKDAGAYVVKSITATGESQNFENAVRIVDAGFEVAPKSKSSFKLANSAKIELPYTGSPVKPDLGEGTVVDADGKAVSPDDYEVIYPSDSTSMGEKKVEIISTGENYALGTRGEFTYTITAASSIQVSLSDDSYTFAGKEIEPDIIIKDDQGREINAVKGTDYNVTYSNNKNVTTDSKKAKAVITFGGSLAGNKSVTKEFEITPLPVEAAKVEIKAPKNQTFTYDGKVKAPVVTSVSYSFPAGTVKLEEGVDYEVGESASADARIYEVDITGKGNYSGKLGTVSYEIVKARFNETTVDAVANPLAYGGSIPSFKVTNKVSGVEISPNDYQVHYLNEKGEETALFPTDMGSYKAVLTYSGENYIKGDKITVDYKINSATLENALIVLSDEKYTYNPSSAVGGQVPTVTKVQIGTKVLDEAVKGGSQNDYKVEYPKKKDCKDVGTYTIKIIGLNTYAGQTREVTFKIEPKDINELDGFDVVAGTTHAGTAAAPYAEITDRGYTLVPGTDYDLANNAETKTATITGKGNYTTSKAISKKYEVADYMLLADPSIKAVVNGTYAYDGTAKEPKIDDIVLTEVYEGGSFTLRKGVDYEAAVTRYENNDKAGTATVILTGKGSYKGEKAVEFEITGIDIASEHKIDTTKLDKLSLAYSARTDHAGTIINAVSVVNTKTLATLASTNYKVKLYQDGKEVEKAINPGTYTVSVEGDGNYTGSLTYDITITGISLESVANLPSKLDDQPYTGKEVTPEVAITAKSAATKLVKDTDYTVSYLNNIEVGPAYAVIKGIGIYGGTYLVPFNITGLLEQEIVVLPAQERDLKTRTLKSKATKVKYSVEPKTEVTYTSSKPEVATVDAKTGAIEYKAVGTTVITISAAESEVYKAATKELTVRVLPETPADVKVSSTAKRKITVKADKVPEAAKYQIRIQKSGHSSVYVNVNNKGDLEKVYTTKSSGKFNVWVRAYSTIDGVHHFSAWSAKKTVTVK